MCVVRPFNLHVVKHEVLLACHCLHARSRLLACLLKALNIHETRTRSLRRAFVFEQPHRRSEGSNMWSPLHRRSSA